MRTLERIAVTCRRCALICIRHFRTTTRLISLSRLQNPQGSVIETLLYLSSDSVLGCADIVAVIGRIEQDVHWVDVAAHIVMERLVCRYHRTHIRNSFCVPLRPSYTIGLSPVACMLVQSIMNHGMPFRRWSMRM
jgi:hypothetical protein